MTWHIHVGMNPIWPGLFMWAWTLYDLGYSCGHEPYITWPIHVGMNPISPGIFMWAWTLYMTWPVHVGMNPIYDLACSCGHEPYMTWPIHVGMNPIWPGILMYDMLTVARWPTCNQLITHQSYCVTWVSHGLIYLNDDVQYFQAMISFDILYDTIYDTVHTSLLVSYQLWSFWRIRTPQLTNHWAEPGVPNPQQHG